MNQCFFLFSLPFKSKEAKARDKNNSLLDDKLFLWTTIKITHTLSSRSLTIIYKFKDLTGSKLYTVLILVYIQSCFLSHLALLKLYFVSPVFQFNKLLKSTKCLHFSWHWRCRWTTNGLWSRGWAEDTVHVPLTKGGGSDRHSGCCWSTEWESKRGQKGFLEEMMSQMSPVEREACNQGEGYSRQKEEEVPKAERREIAWCHCPGVGVTKDSK